MTKLRSEHLTFYAPASVTWRSLPREQIAKGRENRKKLCVKKLTGSLKTTFGPMSMLRSGIMKIRSAATWSISNMRSGNRKTSCKCKNTKSR